MPSNTEILIESGAEEAMLPSLELAPETSHPARETEEVNRREKISLLAYSHYERRGRIDGYDIEDWLAAELEFAEMESGTMAFPH